MNANALARVLFLMLGVLLIVEFFLNLGRALSNAPLVYASGAGDPETILTNAAFVLAVRAGAAFVFNLLPGMFVLYKSFDWADRLVPQDDEPERYIEFTALLSIGLTLIGYYFVISGLAGVAGGMVSVGFAFGNEVMRELAWKQMASAIALLVSGMVVAMMGRRAA